MDYIGWFNPMQLAPPASIFGVLPRTIHQSIWAATIKEFDGINPVLAACHIRDNNSEWLFRVERVNSIIACVTRLNGIICDINPVRRADCST